MLSTFEEINLYVFYSVQGVFLDGVIWCLGPLADETREYGVMRQYLAVATVKVCRGYLRMRG